MEGVVSPFHTGLLVGIVLGVFLGICLMGMLGIAARESRREDIVHSWIKPASAEGPRDAIS